MKYRFESCPNPEVLVMHLDFVAPRSYEDLDDEDKQFLDSISAIPGIDHFSAMKYRYQFQKAYLFSWEEIAPQIVAAFEARFTPNGHMIPA